MTRFLTIALLVCVGLVAFSCADDTSDEPDASTEDGDAAQAYCVPGSHWENGECVPDEPTDDDDDIDIGDTPQQDGDNPTDDDDDLTDGDNPTDDDDDDDLTDGDTPPSSCDFGYDFQYEVPAPQVHTPSFWDAPTRFMDLGSEVDTIAHMEPAPKGYVTTRTKAGKDLVLPDYEDNMPVFPRAETWNEENRCYELPDGASYFTEEEAHAFYVDLIEETLWQRVDQTANRRTVLGLRGAYPGTFQWHDNLPNRFNDTLVLFWIDGSDQRHVREFPANTDTGAYDFGYHNSSSLRPNRRYPYKNGWHRGYNALAMQLSSYPVRDDNNKNGHWDDDRNGWFAPEGADDHDRDGSAHNIHMGSKNAPLETAAVGVWSAGCQVIPGMDNWLEFINNAWTGEGDNVDYFLIDVRDIAPEFWNPCATEQGTHACPYRITTFPFTHQGNTLGREERFYDSYNCSDTNESGPEVVYVMNLTQSATLSAQVTVTDDDAIDPDIHILSGDDDQGCLARAHESLSVNLPLGRFVLIVDTWVDENGSELAGEYQLSVELD